MTGALRRHGSMEKCEYITFQSELADPLRSHGKLTSNSDLQGIVNCYATVSDSINATRFQNMCKLQI